MDSFQLILNSLKRQILREDEIYPNWHFVTNNICLKAGFNNEDIILQFSVREVTMMDYFRSEATQLIVNYASNKILKTQGVETDDLTSFDQHGGGSESQSFQPMKDTELRQSRQSLSRQSINNGRVISRASRDVDYFNQQSKQPRPSMMQDEFGYPVLSQGSASPRTYGKKGTLVRFTEELSERGGNSTADLNRPQRDPNQVMDNPRLAARSETFENDDGIKVIKRCYFLAIGDDDFSGNAFSLVLSFNVFDEPTVQKKLEVKIKTANVIIELCPEILKSITQLIPEFKAMFRFKDLAPNKKGTARKIELYAALNHIAAQMFRLNNQVSDTALFNEINKHRVIRAKSKSEEEKRRLETYRDRIMIK